MATVLDLQTKIAAIPWDNQEQLITGPLLLDLFLTLASLLAVNQFAGLPTTLPSQPGILWLNGGVLSIS